MVNEAGRIVMNILKLILAFFGGFVVAYILQEQAEPPETERSSHGLSHSYSNAYKTADSTPTDIQQLLAENQRLQAQVALLELPIAANDDLLEQPLEFTPSSSESTLDEETEAGLRDEIQNNLNVFTVKPVLFSLTNQLQLAEQQSEALEQLLSKKAQADLDAWLMFSKQAQSQPDNADYFHQQYMDEISQNTMDYERTIEQTLSSEQLAQYQGYEQKQAQLQASQKRDLLTQSLSRLELSAFQRQEIQRLSAQVYTVSGAVSLGSSGSPYTNSSVQTDFEKLAQIKALFSEEQQRKLSL